ncbi:MAG TPA: nicotinate phosphoribosyltransferase, partial [Erwinia persicina]|nr:nicotinate phosphoribosyltransferase [Erwinia persicina]
DRDPSRSAEQKGSVEVLWEIFGGTVNAKGYKVLDPHVGLIYGDSITLERADQILSRLEAKGFASSNVVFGVGSYTYQYNTRDTFGFAMKATYGEVNGVGREIFKQPKTDNGMKNSARGLLRVEKDDEGKYCLLDSQSWQQEQGGELKIRFLDGKLHNVEDLTALRQRLAAE